MPQPASTTTSVIASAVQGPTGPAGLGGANISEEYLGNVSGTVTKTINPLTKTIGIVNITAANTHITIAPSPVIGASPFRYLLLIVFQTGTKTGTDLAFEDQGPFSYVYSPNVGNKITFPNGTAGFAEVEITYSPAAAAVYTVRLADA